MSFFWSILKKSIENNEHVKTMVSYLLDSEKGKSESNEQKGSRFLVESEKEKQRKLWNQRV